MELHYFRQASPVLCRFSGDVEFVGRFPHGLVFYDRMFRPKGMHLSFTYASSADIEARRVEILPPSVTE